MGAYTGRRRHAADLLSLGPARLEELEACALLGEFEPSMGLALGGRMKQEVYMDPYGLDAWDQRHAMAGRHR